MNSKQLTLSSEPKKSYSRSLQKSTDVVIDSENNIRISGQCTTIIADNRNKLNGLLHVSQYSKFEFRSLLGLAVLDELQNTVSRFNESITTSVLFCRERLYDFFGSLLSVNCFEFIFNQNLSFQNTCE
jgi:hypothetical protein